MITRSAAGTRYSLLSCGVFPFHYPEAQTQLQPSMNVASGVCGILSTSDAGISIIAQGETVTIVQEWRGGLGHTNIMYTLFSLRRL
ncbi:hypothetical protein BZA77DRAFT_352819 [Pyronema omphalodes]|nr:hypothetical protein BZA77DRAFT_352819 [Pyronema omphalodes]